VGAPRYVLHVYRHVTRDGRTQFPIAFLCFIPTQIPIQAKVLYTRPIVGLCDAFSVGRALPLEEAEDLTDEWLVQKLALQ
tara:strand:+ start:20 stop:259 length:240 start_codon:yes stop_codon:yes gene_type:complete